VEVMDDATAAYPMGIDGWIQLKAEERSVQLQTVSNFVMVMCFSPSSCFVDDLCAGG